MASNANSHASRTAKLGRSGVTGQFVLKPATSKGATVSYAKVRDAVRKVAEARQD